MAIKALKIAGVILLAIFVLVIIMLTLLSMKPAVPGQYWNHIALNTSGDIEKKYNALGEYEVVKDVYAAPNDERDKGDNHYVVWHPAREGNYPLVIMVNGTGVPCDKYEDVFRHFASWGYVVIGNNYGTNWDGLHPSETLDFALHTTEVSAYLDPDRIAIGGHSQGGMGAFNAVTEYENGRYYQVLFSLSPTNDDLALALQWGFHLNTDAPYAFRLENIEIPTLLAAGTGSFDNDTVSPLPKMEQEFANLHADKVMFRRSENIDHGDLLYQANGYVIAWLDYYLKDAVENEAAFFGENPEIQGNGRYQDFNSQQE